MMKRAHVDELYTAYLDGTLPDALRQQVDEHLRVCPECAHGLEEMRLLVADLHALSTVALPDEFVAGVRTRVQALPMRPARPWLRPVLAWGSLAVAASLVLMLCRIPTPQVPVARTPGPVAEQPAAPVTKDAPITPKPATMSTPNTPVIAAAPKVVPARPAPAPRLTTLPTTGMKLHRIQHNESVTAEPDKQFNRTAPPPARIEIAMAPPMPTRMALNEMAVMADTSETPAPATDSMAGSKGDQGMSISVSTPGYAEDGTAAESTRSSPPANGAAIMATKAAPETMATARDVQFAAVAPFGRVMSKNALSQAVQNTAQGSLTAEVQGSQLLLQVVAKPASQLTLQYADAPNVTAQQVQLPSTVNSIAVTLPALPDGATLAVGVGQKDAQYLLVVPGRPVDDGFMTNRPTQQKLQTLANAAGAYVLCPQDFATRPVTTTAGGLAPLAALQQLAQDAGYQFEYNPPWVNITRK